jgi:GrpB-like predicted nucleotidyltransferase (UPF0157 family)
MNHDNKIFIGGVDKRDIMIVDYNPSWPGIFQFHEAIIAQALGVIALRIEHMGSTAVPGLAAKPIIDILLVVEDSGNEAAYLPRMEGAGYELRIREPDWHQHRMLRTPEGDVHIHVYSVGCPEIDRIILFRNQLRLNPNDRNRYEQAKRKLAKQSWESMDDYAKEKSEVVEAIIAAASSMSENHS